VTHSELILKGVLQVQAYTFDTNCVGLDVGIPITG